eukprot:COSAG01_NODE_63_length_29632_cov_270.650662_16_plen_91_part_00
MVERTLSITEVAEAAEEGRLLEAFSCGTAAVISPVITTMPSPHPPPPTHARRFPHPCMPALRALIDHRTSPRHASQLSLHAHDRQTAVKA